jgi:hypothetical protein
MQFSDLGLIPPLAAAVASEGYVTPTPIQARAIPHVIAGRDLLGLAQTGTGKTAAAPVRPPRSPSPSSSGSLASARAGQGHHATGRFGAWC